MKTRNLSTTGALILGALGALAASIAACSAQSSGAPPRGNGTAGQTSSGGSGNAAAGSSVILGGGTGNTGNTGTAGTLGTGTAGTFGTGAGGTFGTGVGGTGTGVAGTGTGTGGAAAMSCGSLTVSPADPACCVAAGTATDVSIDDLEDMNNAISPLGNRQGYWYSYKDTVGSTLMPATMPFPVATGGHGGMYSIGISGMVAAVTATVPAAYAGMGFDLNNHFKKSCPYGGSVYHGISFWAKGTVPFKVSIKIPATTAASSLSVGTCAAMCEDHYSSNVAAPPDGTTWGQINIMFSALKQAGWGTPVATFDAANILAVQFQIDGTMAQTGPVAYAFAVDDLAFIP